MLRPVRASQLGIFKDILLLLILIVSLAILLLVLLPGFQDRELAALQRRYIEEQEILVRRTVDDTAESLVSQDRLLEEAGLGAPDRDHILLAGLSKQRFGVGGFGYFFVFSRQGVMLMHPIQADLVGRNLSSVLNPDGVNMGELLFRALAPGQTSRVEYRWTIPGMDGPEAKTTFLREVPSKGWVLASGYYHSDFNPTRDAFLRISKDTLDQTRFYTVLLSLGLGLLAVFFGVVVYLRVRFTERSLSRHMSGLEQYKVLLDRTSLVSRTDPQGLITYVNDTFCEVTGYSRESVIGQSHNVERHPDTPREVFRDLWATISQGRVWQGTLKNRKADGSSYIKRATIVPILDETGTIIEYLSSGHDITEVIENRSRLQAAFMTDSLTGLGNRGKLLFDLENGDRGGLCLIDVVRFSDINKIFGQAAGDLVLRQLAATLFDLTEGWRPHLYRLQADTFALVRSGIAWNEFETLVRKLADQLSGFTVPLADQGLSLLFRFGLASGGVEPLLLADEALRRAREGRKVLVVHDPGTDPSEDLVTSLKILQTLRWALDHNRVVPVFQPIIDLADRRVRKYECLMRVEDSEGRTLVPSEFMELSKKTRLYLALSQRVLHLGLEAVRTRDFELSVNLTLEDIQSEETMDYLLAEVRRTGVGPRLILELVETEELEALDRTNLVFEALRAEGVRLAVDDFGSGYASFDYLLRLNPAFVKIDGSIIQKLTGDPRAQELLSSIVTFARKAGMKTVAEFLDSEELVRIVQDLGVDYGQGWFFGKAGPLPPKARRPA